MKQIEHRFKNMLERESLASWMLSLLTICQVWPLLGTLATGEGKAEDAT
jgi:hypothetical protein